MGVVKFSEKKTESKKRVDSGKGVNVFLQVTFVLLSVFMFYNIGRSLYQTNQKFAVLKRAENEVDELREDNIELVMELDDVNRDEFIEAEVRDRLNYGRDGEVQLIIEEELIDRTLKQLNYEELGLDDTKEYSRSEIFNIWIDFFLNGM